MSSGKKSPAKTKPPAPPPRLPATSARSRTRGEESRGGVHVQWRGGGAHIAGAPLCTRLSSGLGTGRGGVTAGVACARRSDTDGAQARGLTVNESEGPQEHDPAQPEGARAQAARAARGVVPGSRRRHRLLASVRSLPPPKLLPGRRHRGAVRGHAQGGLRPPPAGRPRPLRRGGAASGRTRPRAGSCRQARARVPPADRAGRCDSEGRRWVPGKP